MVSYFMISKGVINLIENQKIKSLIPIVKIRRLELFDNYVNLYYDGVTDKIFKLDFPSYGNVDEAARFYDEIHAEMVKIYG